ncbi:hypothetical protein [Pectinatus frisingensis]|uniref:hypothetical protein n=1 Tax=Pectinatus frisingensis TaxID=865 RepID=UPI0018C5471D|nr:hypothetical protein [Pectinatus frisingensis]
MDKKIMCPMCLKRGEYNEMAYTTDGYFKCKKCKTEVWPGDLTPDELTKFMREMAPTHYSTDALPSGEAMKGKSGNNNLGRNTDGGKKKKTPQQLYNQLFKET